MKIKSYKKYNDVWNGIGDKIKKVSSGECDYRKDYMKIKFNFDDNLPLNKPLKFYDMTLTIRSVFEEDGKLYPKVFLEDSLYELTYKKARIQDKIDISEGIDVNKTSLSKECDICHYWYFRRYWF